MNVDDHSKEPATDLRLSLDYSNRGTQVIENSGAGANATSRVDMAFVASDHLKELVWSPSKGLSIKCTNCSTAAEESRRALTMGMSNKTTSASQASESKPVTGTASAKFPARNGRIGVACQSAYMPVNEGSRCNSTLCPKDVLERHIFPVRSMHKVSSRKRSFDTINKHTDLCLRENTEEPQVGLASNMNDVNQQSNSLPEESQKGIGFKKHELHVDDDFVAVASNTINSGFLNEDEFKHHRNDVSTVKGKIYRGEDSPTDSKINEYRRKGKANVLSDVNVGHGEEGSRRSIESCSSVGSFCSQRKKRSLGQEFTNESKRSKTTVQPSPSPTSLVNGSGSFIGWISNMTKGINKANKEGTPCLALTLTPARPQNENSERELIPHRNNEKYSHQRAGFQNIFESIYCTNYKVHGQTTFTDERQKNGEPFDPCGGNSMVDVVPLSTYEMTSSSCKGDQSSGNGARQLKLQKVLSRIGDNKEHYSPEKGESCNFLTKVQTIKLTTSTSSPDICRTQNNDSSPLPEIKAGLTNAIDPLQSFWVTRFCPKSAIPKSVADNRGRILCVDNQARHPEKSIFRSSQLSKVVQPKRLLIELHNELVGVQGYTASDSDVSIGLKKDANLTAQISECSTEIFSTERLKSSEAMASTFARRLDAIKHMTPAGKTSDASGAGTTCFYCGRKGHSLRNCSEFTENKLEDLLDRSGSEKAPRLCTQCFQVGRCATDCLNAPSKVSGCGALVIPNSGAPEILGDRSNKEALVEKKDIPVADAPSTACNQTNPEPDLNLHKHYAKSGHVEFELEESSAAPLRNSIDGQGSDIPKGYFDAVRLLRLSRREILKLIDSQTLVSNLEGFFLRLRLGNVEKGLDRNGYHVAYIDGVRSEESCRGSNLILPVNMGSIKCLVGSQSISNQDFLEDELMAWWSAIVKNGNKLPTQEELNNKLVQKKNLGL
ncbi:unnamed protein product [Rhodiola kirilowii]